MRYIRMVLIVALVFFVNACSTPLREQGYAEQYGHRGGRGQGFRLQPYRASQEIHTCIAGKIHGSITSLRVESFGADMEPGLALEVQSQDKGGVHVHLGPLWFLERQEADLKPGDEVTIQGFCYVLAGRERLFAAEITHKDHTLRLRDAQGIPYWEAWRQN